MEFEDRYEHIQIGFKDHKEGLCRTITKNICSQCRKSTHWVYWPKDIKSHSQYVCSDECLEKLKFKGERKWLKK